MTGYWTILVVGVFVVNARPHPAAWQRAVISAMILARFGRCAAKEETMRRYFRPCLTSGLACGAILLLAALIKPAVAAEQLRVAKVVPFAWSFTPLDIGIQTGIFAKHGLDIEESASAGDAKLQQLLTADSVDIGIGSGPGMAFSVKGVPAKAVAAMYGLPRNMAVMVGYDSDVKTVDGLKGKKLGVTTVGSLTAWIGDRINAKEGWGDHGIVVVPIGGMPPARAAIKTQQIDGYIGALETGYALEEAKEWRVITSATPFVDHFITHVIFARDELIEKHPETVRAFLQGWFETIAFMKANRAKSVEISAKVINVSPEVAARVYDEQIGAFSTDGTFDPQAVAVIKKSFIDMGLLKEVPDDNALFTTQFVPVKAGM
jgi:ABC-type nitrate/sulfonate/bicarbonate transport system substrate-binding protein